MDEDLKQYLDGMERRTQQSIEALETRLTARTQQSIEALEHRTQQNFDAFEHRNQQNFDALEHRLTERMRDMQTELLKAFGPWHESVQVRVRQVELATKNSDAAVMARMDTLERRLWEIEKKLLIDPPAA